MVTIVKHEWHQVDSQFAYELTKDTLEEIYPDMDEDELDQLWADVEYGDADLDQILQDAWSNDVEIEWDRQYDDWWTDRKGGYDITYEYGDEDSWHHEPPPPEPTHKCTKCKWTGQSYEAHTLFVDENGQELEKYKNICPYCESDVELTEAGIVKEKEDIERRKRWAQEDSLDDSEE